MKISAIIPAYNEEKTINDVINVLQGVKFISEVIVVSDGSTDRTPQIVKREGKVKLIELSKNKGKGAALVTGTKLADADILLFLDADLIGLTKKHVKDLVMPVIRGEAEMTRGIFTNGRRTTDISHRIAPGISGQRAVKREVIESIPNLDKTRFGVEVVLNRYIKKRRLRLKRVRLPNLTHRLKEEKFGIKRGLSARMKMYWEVLRIMVRPKRYYSKGKR